MGRWGLFVFSWANPETSFLTSQYHGCSSFVCLLKNLQDPVHIRKPYIFNRGELILLLCKLP